VATVIAFKCKTPGCNAWLKLNDSAVGAATDMSNPSSRDQSIRIACWRCKEGYEYFPGDKRMVELQSA